MNIGDHATRLAANAVIVDQVMRRRQNLIGVKQHPRRRPGEQHAVLWRHQKITAGAKCPCLNADRGPVSHRRNSCFAHPAHRLKPIVTGKDQISLGQLVNRDRPGSGGDPGAGGKADDFFNIGKCQTRAIQQGGGSAHGAIFCCGDIQRAAIY